MADLVKKPAGSEGGPDFLSPANECSSAPFLVCGLVVAAAFGAPLERRQARLDTLAPCQSSNHVQRPLPDPSVSV